MKILIIGTDETALSRMSDANARFIEYSRLVERVDALILTDKRMENIVLTEKVAIHPTGRANKVFNFISGFRRGVRIIRDNKIDLVITQDPIFIGLLGLFLKFYCRVKLLASVYGTNVFDNNWRNESVKNRLFAWIGSFVMSRADAIQTDGFETVDELKKIFGVKVFWKPVIPTNINDFRGVRKFDNDMTRILFVGRLVKQKNIEMLIDVIARMVKNKISRPYKFTIIGKGPLQGYLLASIKEKGLSDAVEYIEEASRKEMVDFYQASDIFILCSNYEGFPKVFMEAAAAGLPIVTTKVSGVANLVRDGVSGFVVPIGEAIEFSVKLGELIDDVELRRKMSAEASRYFWENYSVESMLKQQKMIFDFVDVGNSADYKAANVDKYRESEERKKYFRQSGKMSKMEYFKKNVHRFVSLNEKILDIGGGAGIWTDLIRGSGLTQNVTAVDISPDVLRERNILDKSVVGDMEALPFGDESFDRSMFFAALHHSDKTEKVLSEAVRVTKNDGHLFLFEPISLKTIFSFKQIKPVDNGAEFAFSPLYFFYHLRKQGLTAEYLYFMGFFSRFLGGQGLRAEELINKIPFLRCLFGILANYIVVVVRKK